MRDADGELYCFTHGTIEFKLKSGDLSDRAGDNVTVSDGHPNDYRNYWARDSEELKKQIVYMRKRGWTYEEIGRELNLPFENARKYAKEKRANI